MKKHVLQNINVYFSHENRRVIRREMFLKCIIELQELRLEASPD